MSTIEQAYEQVGGNYQDVLKLFEPTNEITEVLRAGSLEGTEELFAQVEAEYNNVVNALNSCL